MDAHTSIKRALPAVFAGTITLFVLGFLLYVVLLGGFYASNLGSATGVVREVPVPWAMIVAHLGLASLLTYVLVIKGVSSAVGGLKVGAILGLMFGVAVAFDLFAVTNWSNVNVAFVEPFVTATRLALAGAVVGWALGKGAMNAA